MWTKIFLFLWIVGTIKQRSTSIQIDCAKRVQRCPVGKEQWAQKSEELQCRTNYGYVCLRDSTGYLYESCMADFTVQANTGNCPVLLCNEKKPHLGTEDTFHPCPEEVLGCPPKKHPGYRIHHLYKYPKCVESSFSAEIENTSPKSITMDKTRSLNDVNRQDNTHVVILILCFALLFVVVGSVIGYIVYSKKNDYSNVTSEDTEGTCEGDLKSEELRCWIQSINESKADKVRILPLKEDYTIEVDRIYVPVSIVDESEIRTNGETSKRTILEISPDKMFYINPGNPARFIFLLGDAGYGKTVQCQRIAKSWCKAWKTENLQEGKNSGIEGKNVQQDSVGEIHEKVTNWKEGNMEKDKEWERSLKEFDFLFFVPMRDLNNEHERVDDILCDYYLRFDLTRQYLEGIRDVLKDQRYKCLIILDGLDEWNISECMKESLLHKGIPNCEGMLKCTFLITMRSWRFMEVDPICRQGLFDKVFRLHGLYDSGIEELTTNMLCNYFNTERNSEEFHQQLESIRKKSSRVFLKSLMKIPLLALFYILTWHEHIETGHSLTTFYLSMLETLIKMSLKLQIETKGRDDHGSSVSSILDNFFCVRKRMPEILRLGKMAFNDFTSQNATFVLRDAQLRNPEVKKTVDFFLRIGLLSSSDESGKIHENNVRISFLHKTMQEFIFSLCLCQDSEEADILKFVFKEVKDIEKALELSTVITFISGLSPSVGCEISRHIDKLSSEDGDICKFRGHFSTETYNKVFHLFSLQLSCYREVRRGMSMADFQHSGLKFSLSDIILLGNDTDDLTIRESAEILRYHANDIKSLCMKFISNDSVEGISNTVLTEFLHESESLTALDIDGYDRGTCRLFDDSSKGIPRLSTLGLFNVAFTDNILTDFLLKEESKREMIALGLFYIKSADDLVVDFQYQLSSVHRLHSARSGYVQKRIMRPLPEISKPKTKKKEDKPLLKGILEVLPSYEKLSTLHVSYMDSEEDREKLLLVLPNIKTLTNFGYIGTSIYPKPDCQYDTNVIKALLGINKLRTVFLNDIILKEHVLNFESLSRLEEVTLEVFKMSPTEWSAFVSSLSFIKNLRKVILNDTDIDDKSFNELKLRTSRSSFSLVMDKSAEWQETEEDV